MRADFLRAKIDTRAVATGSDMRFYQGVIQVPSKVPSKVV